MGDRIMERGFQFEAAGQSKQRKKEGKRQITLRLFDKAPKKQTILYCPNGAAYNNN